MELVKIRPDVRMYNTDIKTQDRTSNFLMGQLLGGLFQMLNC